MKYIPFIAILFSVFFLVPLHPQGLMSTHVPSLESNNSRMGGEWRSSLYPERWKPGFGDAAGRFLHDFSHAGYHGGNRPVPHVTENIVDVSQAPYYADHSGVADVTGILQQALDDVGMSGGGVVFLPAGTYRIKIPAGEDHGLVISHDKTILRGAGPDSTFLFHDESYMRFKEIIYVSGGYSNWFNPTGTTSQIRVDLNMPTRIIPVKSVAGFQQGEQVIVNSIPTDEFIKEHGMAGIWTASAIKGVAFKRRIDSIDAVSNLLILDTPTRYSLKTRDIARVYDARDHLVECGIENLSVGNRENPKSGWDEESWEISGTGAFDAHFSHAIVFEYSEDCWIRNVRTYRPGENIRDIHLLSNCLLLNMCRHITVDSCDFQKPQYEGGGGNGYMYTLQSNDCLIKNSRANHSRHNYDFKYPYSNGNVIYNCRGENSKYSSDFHMYLSMSNLFDKCTMDGDYLESMFRPYGGPLHGYSSTQSVFYNTAGENYHPGKDYIVDSRQYKWGYVIGTSGPAYMVKTDPVSGLLNGYTYDTSPRDFVEGVGEGSDLRPVSLYLDQLDRRKKDSSKLHTYQVEIRVENQLNGEPVPGTEITLYNDKALSDANGSALFYKVHESFILSISNNKYLPYSTRQVVIYSDTVLTIRLEENKYKVTLELLDELSLQPFWGVSITLNDEVEVSDNEGKAYFTTFAGANSYSFQKISYRPVEGILDVQSDTLVQFLLTRTHADVKIRLKEGNTPVNNAEVKIGDAALLSNSLGLAKFLQLPVDQACHYSVSKEAYVFKEGDFLLSTDTTIDVSMEKLSSSAFTRQGGTDIRIWPNPTSGLIYMDLPVETNMKVRILDLNGALIREHMIRGTESRLDISTLPGGIYILCIPGNEDNFRKLIVKL
ncbi:MAG: T9SS type A sorting domain-containing protein [Bacteroidota bacterium]